VPTLSQLAAEIEMLRAKATAVELELQRSREEAERYKSNFLLLQRILHASKSEKAPLSKEELTALLFNEAEEVFARKDLRLGADGKRIEVKAHARGKRGRNTVDLSKLPVEEVIVDLPPAEKCCAGCGADLKRIGEEVSEKLHVPPMRPVNMRTIRPKYACSRCEGVGPTGDKLAAVKVAPLPPQVAGRSVINDVTLANAITAKFAYAIPFYRFSSMLGNLGVAIHRLLFCRGAIRFYRRLEELGYFEAARRELIRAPTIAADETKFQILKVPGRKPQNLSFMHAAYGLWNDGRGIVVFRCSPSRSVAPLSELLRGWDGTLLSDGFASYDALCDKTNWIHAGCHVHVRREFHRAWLERGKPSSGAERELLDCYAEIYKVEGEARAMSAEERLLHRQLNIPVIREKMENIISEYRTKTPPQSRLGKALSYAFGQWPKLWHCLSSADIPLDNNAIENLIRPFVIGRKNWLFADTIGGAEASAGMYTVVQNANLNGLDPYKYLLLLAKAANTGITSEGWGRLMPNRVSKADMG